MMKRIWATLSVSGAVSLFAVVSATAQISYVTVRTPRSPVPPMTLIQSNSPPAGVAQPGGAVAPRIVQPRIQTKPSLDKEELERRVVAFQKQRASEGFASAQYELGVRYFRGNGVVKDLSTARKWIALAAGAGHPEAQKKLRELEAEEQWAAAAPKG